jgi:nitrite reductase/ring-hydroxylating ferredoxin subunit
MFGAQPLGCQRRGHAEAWTPNNADAGTGVQKWFFQTGSKITFMNITRRNFLLLTAGLMSGCQSADDGVMTVPIEKRTVNAGPAGNYAADGIYKKFDALGFFIIQRDGKLLALSSFCTHRRCKLAAEADRSFYCKCHGSTFDPAGHVTEGPAKRDLPIFPSYKNGQGELMVDVPAM